MKLLSWNINGIRATYKKGFPEWFRNQDADIICVQEVKASISQIPEELYTLDGYHPYFAAAEKKGYSGVGVWSKGKPHAVTTSIGREEFDREGRVIRADYDDFILFNVYFPNGGMNEERLNFKLRFYDYFLDMMDNLVHEGKNIVLCGDINTAHTEIDLARPKENTTTSGFMPIERAWLDKVVEHGYIDTFRALHPEAKEYSFWDMRHHSRERNVGWRLDYFFVNQSFHQHVNDAFIQSNVYGSDHCPVGIELKL